MENPNEIRNYIRQQMLLEYRKDQSEEDDKEVLSSTPKDEKADLEDMVQNCLNRMKGDNK